MIDILSYLMGAATGGGDVKEAPLNEVNFLDYDGKRVYSYTAQEFAALDEMPKNPEHKGLTAQGWNWTLADAKAHVAAQGALDIGQTYITNDGATRVYIHLADARIAPYLGICPAGTAAVDWGDGKTDTVTGSSTTTAVFTQHTYDEPGDYVISIAMGDGESLGISGLYSNARLLSKNASQSANFVYTDAIKKVELGRGVTAIGEYAFINCYRLETVTIPNGVTSIGSSAFENCRSLRGIVIPSSVTATGTAMARNCSALTFCLVPPSVTNVGGSNGNALNGASALQRFILPNSATDISTGMYNACYALTRVIIPDSVGTIAAAAFFNCYGIGEVHFLGATPPVISGSNAFQNLQADCVIYVPASEDHSVLNAYTSATNYPSSQTYTYLEE